MKTQIETTSQKEIADYNAYLQLKQLKYSNIDIAKHMNYTLEELSALISQYTFISNLEYIISEQQGDYLFKGELCFSPLAGSVLSNEDIEEIIKFIQELVEQHNGLDYEQKFYHIDGDCQLLVIDTSFKCQPNEQPKLLVVVKGEKY